MILPSMSYKEVAKHIVSEVTKNQKRIDTKAYDVAKQMLKAGRKTYAYQQKIGSNTLLTIYIFCEINFQVSKYRMVPFYTFNFHNQSRSFAANVYI